MYLFSRRARLSGTKLQEAMAWGASTAERATQITGLQIGLFTAMFSPPVGTLIWGTFVPDLATLEAATDKLNVDDGFNADVERGQQYLLPGTTTDSLSVILSPPPDQTRRPEYIASVRTTIANGRLARGMALGLEIAKAAEAITGVPTLFAADATGTYGGVAWFTGFDNVAQLERAEMAINTNEGFIKLIDSNADVFTSDPAASQQLVVRRIAG